MDHDNRGQQEIRVTHVRPEGKWIKLFVQFDPILASNIESIVQSRGVELDQTPGFVHQCQLPTNTHVCVRCPNGYYRGIVTGWTPDNQQTVAVKFVDYGHEDIVNISALRRSGEDLFKYEPLAVECYLADIQAGENETFSHKAMEMCSSLVCFQDNITCVIMSKYDVIPIIRVYYGNVMLAHTLIESGIGIRLGGAENSNQVTKRANPPGYFEPVNSAYHAPVNSYRTSSQLQPYRRYTPSPEPYSYTRLEPQKYYKVIVRNIEKSGAFFIQLADGELERQNLNKAILAFVSSKAASPILNFTPGTPCIARCSEDDCFQRAKIKNATGLVAQVFFTDTGVTEQIPLSQLRVLPNCFLNLPKQAFECTLGPQIPSFDLDLFCEIVTGKILVCQVLNDLGKQYLVRLFYDDKNLLDIMNTRRIEPLNYPRDLPVYRYITLPTKRSFRIKVTQVYGPYEIFCQLEDNVKQVVNLMDQMHEFYVISNQGVAIRPEQCMVGGAVCCFITTDESFFRAEVMEEPLNGQIRVKLVDYGNNIIVKLSNVKLLEAEFLALPAQGIELSLYGMDKLPKHLVDDATVVRKLKEISDGKVLIAEIMNELQPRKYSAILRTSDNLNINNIVVEEDVIISVPMSLNKVEDVVVTNYDGPQSFFGQLCKIPIFTFEEFTTNLDLYYSSLPSMVYVPRLHQYVCARFSNSYYRAQVTKILDHETIEVAYVDYGNKEIRGLHDIYPLTAEFAKMPQMGIQCGFFDVPSHVNLEHLSELMPDSKIQVEIVKEVGDVKLVKLTDHQDNFTLLKLWKKPEPKKLPYSQPSFPHGAVEQVVVTDFTSYNKFVCQRQFGIANLDDMMASLDRYYKSLKPGEKVLQTVVVGGSCVAKYSEDGVWYRARIAEIPQAKEINVYFVDYGNSEVVSSNDVKEIVDEYMKLPVFAVQCSLADAADLSTADVEKFKEEVLNSDTLTATFSGQDPVTKLHRVELRDPLTGLSIASKYLKSESQLSQAPVNDSSMWGETGSSNGKQVPRGSNWNSSNRSPRRNEDFQNQDKFRNGTYTGQDSDEAKGRLITKKNIDDIPILIDYQYEDIKLHSYSDIIITHVVNPREFYAQLPEYGSKLLALLEEMTQLYGSGAGHDSVPRMKPGDPCAVLNPEDSFWYRGSVYNMLGHQIEVQLVDYGHVEVVPLANVKQLKPQFFKLPLQALKLSLPSVAPPDGRSWPLEAIELFRKKVMNKCLLAKFLETKGKGAYFVNLIEAEKLRSDNVDQELASLGLCKLESQPSTPATFVEGVTIEPYEVPIGSTSNVTITWFKSCSKFFCQIHSQPFEKLMEDLQVHYSSLPILDEVVERPLPDTYCITQYSEDQAWYRAQILSTNRNNVAVVFIDYGNCDNVTRKYVKNIKKGFEKLPKQAILCYLKGVESDKVPSPEELETIYGGSLTCHFLGKKDDGYLVEVYSDGKNVAQALASSGVVKSIEDNKPALAHVPVERKVQSPFPKISLPNGEFEVVVIYTESPHKFYCQKVEAGIQLEELMECIMKYCTTQNPSTAKNIQVGSAYVAKYSEDERWYRAIVLSTTETEAEVKFIDFGNEEHVPKSMIVECTRELLDCCPEFLELPEQAFECCLYGVAKNIPENLDNLFCDTVDNKDVVVEVHDKIGGIHLVSVWDKSTPNIVEVGLNIFGPPLPYPRSFSPVTMPPTQCEVYVSNVESISKFSVQLKSQESTLEAIVDDLTRPENRGNIISKIEAVPGLPCCALFSEDGVWYRAIILSVENELATVQFVDYGNTDICNLSTGAVTSISEKLLKIPPISFECALKNYYQVSPESLDELSEQFEDLTADKVLTAKFSGIDFPLQVELFEDGVNIADKFLLPSISVPTSLLTSVEATLPQTVESQQPPPAKVIQPTPTLAATTYPPAQFPIGLTKLYVSHTDSVNSFYVQLVSQSNLLDEMMMELALINPEASVLVENAQPGTICIAPYSEDGSFYRAQILEVDGVNCKVRFVDYGNCDIVLTSCLVVPSPNLVEKPVLAMECTLKEVVAKAGKEQEALLKFHSLVEDQELDGTILTTDSPAQTVLVVNSQNISDILYQEGLIVKTSVSKPQTQLTSTFKSDLDCFPPCFLPPNTEAVPMNLVHATALDRIYLQLWDKLDELADLGIVLNDFYNENPNLVLEEIFVGMSCVAQFTEDELWYRAQILSFNEGLVTVFFVDYGNEDVVPLEKVRRITKEFIANPPYAIECQFKRLAPTATFEKEVIDQLTELTFERKVIVQFINLTEIPYDIELTIEGEEMPLSEKLILDGLAHIVDKTLNTSCDVVTNELVSSNSTMEFVLPVYIPSNNSQVYVSYTNSIESFFVTLQSNENGLLSLVDKIEEYCSSDESSPLDSVKPGTACACLYSEDGLWYRAQVLEIHGTKATVKFIDYGNIEDTEVKDLKRLSTELILIPPFSFECKLQALKVKANCQEESKSLFETLTLDKKLFATFHSREEPVEVRLYDGEIFPHNDIASKLLTSGLLEEVISKSEPVHVEEAEPSGEEVVLTEELEPSGEVVALTEEFEPSGEVVELTEELEPSGEEVVLTEELGPTGEVVVLAEELEPSGEVVVLTEELEPSGEIAVTEEFEPVEEMVTTEESVTETADVVGETSVATEESLSDPSKSVGEELISTEESLSDPSKSVGEEEVSKQPDVDSEESEILGKELVPEKIDTEETDSDILAETECSQLNQSEETKSVDLPSPLSTKAIAGESDKEVREESLTTSGSFTSFTEIEVPIKHKVYALVPHSISPSEFYLNLLSERNKLEDLMTKLTEVYTGLLENEMSLDEITVGQPCVGLYLEDLHWYRCKVIDVSNDDQVTVLLVDYGNVVQINKVNLKAIEPDLLELPTQAIKASLYGVKHLNEGETQWSQQVCNELSSIFEKDGEERRFLTEFIDKINDEVLVKLLDVGISVAEVLEEKGLVRLEREVQFPSVSSTGQLDQSSLMSEDDVIESRVLPSPSREDKIVPGTIAMGRVLIEEEIRNKEEKEKIQNALIQQEKPVPGFVTYLDNEEVFCTSSDDGLDDISPAQPKDEVQKVVVAAAPSPPIPRPLSREDKILPGLLSRGLMEEEQRILEEQEANQKTPKGHDEKMLPGTLFRNDPEPLLDSSKEEQILDESIDISSDLSESPSIVSHHQKSIASTSSILDQEIPTTTSTPSDKTTIEEISKSKIIPHPEVSTNGNIELSQTDDSVIITHDLEDKSDK